MSSGGDLLSLALKLYNIYMHHFIYFRSHSLFMLLTMTHLYSPIYCVLVLGYAVYGNKHDTSQRLSKGNKE